jgi:3-keto-disaccharide hydrolase
MRAGIGIVAAVCAYLGGCSSGSNPENPPAAQPQTGPWQTLFDGTSLDGWKQVGNANWELADHTVRADAGTGFLLTESAYADFDLDLEFWVTADANSGVFLRCQNPAELGAATCYEVNIFDQRPDPSYRTGAIVGVAKPSVQIQTGERWNRYEISARGRRLRVTLNGQPTVDVENDRFAAGPIALQYGAGRVMFRNVRIRMD